MLSVTRFQPPSALGGARDGALAARRVLTPGRRYIR